MVTKYNDLQNLLAMMTPLSYFYEYILEVR